MIAHIVLFRPKPDLTAEQRAAFIDALQHALENIPSIKRAHVGRRLTLGREYDAQNPHDFAFVALLEFDSEADLGAYLEHPAHQRLGEQFYLTAEAALVFDYDLVDASRASEFLSTEG